MKDAPLKVEIFGGKLIISIGIETLCFAAVHHPEWPEDQIITDYVGFTQDVAAELEDEQEDGTTPVHLMIDAACMSALEYGSEYVDDMPSDDNSQPQPKETNHEP